MVKEGLIENFERLDGRGQGTGAVGCVVELSEKKLRLVRQRPLLIPKLVIANRDHSLA